jgi:ABC-type transporter Mla MlaB component
MTKRKKASSPSRRAHGGHIPALSRAAGAARERSTVGRRDPDAGDPAVPPQASPQAELQAAPQAELQAAPQPPAQAVTLTLPAECTVAGAIGLKEQLGGVIGHGQVTLDIGSLQRIDTAAVQLLACFVRERVEGGRETEWQGSAPVLGTAAQLLGLTSMLKLPA